jgi:hypothetical protein
MISGGGKCWQTNVLRSHDQRSIRMSFLNSDTWNLCGLATSLIAPLIPASSKILFWDLLRSLSNAKLLLRSTHFPEAALPITMAKYDDHDWDEVRTSVAPRCCWSHISCSDLSLPPLDISHLAPSNGTRSRKSTRLHQGNLGCWSRTKGMQ